MNGLELSMRFLINIFVVEETRREEKIREGKGREGKEEKMK